ncbi:MAG TPA: hypothetical protein VLM37_06540 [Fibrobacteraceae bacterium]|nr:hypothetical protein [Fibrobacteraceae bacterium]
MKLQMIGVFAAVFLASCASNNLPQVNYIDHPDGRGVPAIDDVIVEMKSEFIKDCYGPIIHREVPETRCQTELFQLLERRYHLDYTKDHVDMASDDLFFRDVDARIRTMVRTDPEVRHLVKANFHSHEELLQYYKGLYGFNPITSQAQVN